MEVVFSSTRNDKDTPPPRRQVKKKKHVSKDDKSRCAVGRVLSWVSLC